MTISAVVKCNLEVQEWKRGVKTEKYWEWMMQSEEIGCAVVPAAFFTVLNGLKVRNEGND